MLDVSDVNVKGEYTKSKGFPTCATGGTWELIGKVMVGVAPIEAAIISKTAPQNISPLLYSVPLVKSEDSISYDGISPYPKILEPMAVFIKQSDDTCSKKQYRDLER